MSEETPAAVEQPEANQESNSTETLADPSSASSDPYGVVVELPAGLFVKGSVHRDVEITPMTGMTRKAIARKESRANPSRITDIIMLQCVNRIGPFDHITNKILEKI